MTDSPLLVRRIWQVDNDSFAIAWKDGQVQRFTLKNLQEHCPCALCTEAREQRVASPQPKGSVSCTHVESVGRYALRVQFTTGCSHGIYNFSLLRKLGLPYSETHSL